MAQSSFYADGEIYDTAVVESNDRPASTETTSAPSGFYPDGTLYDTLAEADTLTAAVYAARDAAGASEIAAAASAAAAASSAATSAVAVQAAAGTASPLMDGTSEVGTGVKWAREDHRHPVDTSRASVAYVDSQDGVLAAGLLTKANTASPTFTGVPAAPTAAPGTNTTQLASTAFVDAARVILEAADALKAPLASPALTGTPTAPTASPGTNTTQLATTAFVEAARLILVAADALKAPLASPALTGTPTAPTQTAGDNSTKLATTAYADAIAALKVSGPATATNGVAALFDGTTGKLIKNSPLIIDPTTGALTRSGGGGVPIQGMGSNAAAVSAGYVGEIISNTISIAADVPLTDNVDKVWNSLSLTAGVWLVGGTCGVFRRGATTPVFIHMHSDHGVGITTIQTSPNGGATTAMHVTSNDPNGWILPVGIKPYVLSSSSTINSVVVANFSAGPAVVYGHLWALRIA